MNDGISPDETRSSSEDERIGFCDRLRTLVPERGENEFARASGISPSSLRHALKTGNPGRTHLVAMARTAGVSLDWLATGRGPMRPRQGIRQEWAAYVVRQGEVTGEPEKALEQRFAADHGMTVGELHAAVKPLENSQMDELIQRLRLLRESWEDFQKHEVAGQDWTPELQERMFAESHGVSIATVRMALAEPGEPLDQSRFKAAVQIAVDDLVDTTRAAEAIARTAWQVYHALGQGETAERTLEVVRLMRANRRPASE